MENNTNETPNYGGGKGDYVSIDEFILLISTACNNANHPEIEPLLTKRGYTPAKIAAIPPKVSNLEALNQKQKKEYSEQYDATENYIRDWKLLNNTYAEHVELARILFENDTNNYVQLGLIGKRKDSFSGYIQQAKLFYANALKDQNVIDQLATKGITKQELDDTAAIITKVEEEKYKQTKETGEARQATKDRDAVYDELAKWYSEFKRTALIALSNKPQLGVILGFK
ncbi:MAG: hypothetical protein ACEQSR_01735 [Candidatus Methylacidiphilales bacterium]